MSDTSRPPLWQVMQGAVDRELKGFAPFPAPPKSLRAAEIRALAYWLAPLEPCTGPLAVIASMEIPEITAIRTCLLAEADRAEAGG